MAANTVALTYTAELKDLRQKLAEIPEITAAEARLAVKQLNKAIKAAGKAGDAAGKAASKSARAASKGSSSWPGFPATRSTK